ncbi:SGNH/GDSL hydrolase family protein [Solidesulfovibrio carbinolicus]|nr:SGNH/GDSL hydrolase family protein [Solidesulfovibrio carbinolicus]
MIIKRILSSLVGVALLLATAEFVYRFVHDKQTTDKYANDPLCVSDAVLGYRFRQGSVSPQGKSVNCINNVGFRGDDVDVIKPKNTYRIVCVGDSATNGVNVHNHETYPGILSEMFSRSQFKDNLKVEVINAGVPGYVTDHHAYLFERYLEISPDLFIFMLGMTDVQAILQRHEGWDTIRKRVAARNYNTFVEYLIQRSRLCSAIEAWLSEWIDELQLQAHEKKDLTPEIEQALILYSKNMQAMIDGCRARGISVFNINYPWNFTSSVGREDNFTPLKDTIKYWEFNLFWQAMPLLGQANASLAAKNNMVYLDPQPSVLKAKDRLLFYGKADFSHPSIQGNFIIATLVYKTLLKTVLRDKIVRECDGFEFAQLYLLGIPELPVNDMKQ